MAQYPEDYDERYLRNWCPCNPLYALPKLSKSKSCCMSDVQAAIGVPGMACKGVPGARFPPANLCRATRSYML